MIAGILPSCMGPFASVWGGGPSESPAVPLRCHPSVSQSWSMHPWMRFLCWFPLAVHVVSVQLLLATLPSAACHFSIPEWAFGFESEFRLPVSVLQPNVSRASLAAALRSRYNVSVYAAESHHSKPDPAQRTAWKVVHDICNVCHATGPPGHVMFELVSPKLLGPTGLDNVGRVLTAMDALGARLDVALGLHVHVDGTRISAPMLQNILCCYVAFEPLVEEFVGAPFRGDQKWYKSNRISVMGSGTLAAAFQRIRACDSMACVQAVGNPPRAVQGSHDRAHTLRRYHKLNILINDTHRHGRKTVEFRQYGPSKDPQEVQAWIAFCVAFVARASALRCDDFPAFGFEELFSRVIRDEALRGWFRGARERFAEPRVRFLPGNGPAEPSRCDPFRRWNAPGPFAEARYWESATPRESNCRDWPEAVSEGGVLTRPVWPCKATGPAPPALGVADVQQVHPFFPDQLYTLPWGDRRCMLRNVAGLLLHTRQSSWVSQGFDPTNSVMSARGAFGFRNLTNARACPGGGACHSDEAVHQLRWLLHQLLPRPRDDLVLGQRVMRFKQRLEQGAATAQELWSMNSELPETIPLEATLQPFELIRDTVRRGRVDVRVRDGRPWVRDPLYASVQREGDAEDSP